MGILHCWNALNVSKPMEVNSASTSQLMRNFYQALAARQGVQGGEKARSLQEATLRLMKDDRYRRSTTGRGRRYAPPLNQALGVSPAEGFPLTAIGKFAHSRSRNLLCY